MKTRLPFTVLLTVALAVPLAGGCAQGETEAGAAAIPANATNTTTPGVVPTSDSPTIAGTPLVAIADPVAAAEKPEAAGRGIEEAPPADVRVNAALGEVVKLVKAGVGNDVLMAFINDSTARFALGANEIIYLKDLGVADEVTAALIDHDRASREATPAAAVPPAIAEAPAASPMSDNATASNEPQYQTPAAEPVMATAPNSDAAYFYDTLAPYGSWVSVPSYGLCWQPTAVVSSPGWQPYLHNGRWVWSDCGWYWASDYSWGWAPFHYGRWFHHAGYGWVWNPGRTWGPAWVSWRYSNAYCGWAPLPPEAGFSASVGFTWYGHGVSTDFEFGLGWNNYAFVSVANFCDRYPSHHVVGAHGGDVFVQTKVVNKIKIKGDNNVVSVDGADKTKVKVKGDNNLVVFEGGADPAQIEIASKAPVSRVSIRHPENSPGRVRTPGRVEKEGNQLVVYQPELPKQVSERTKTALARIEATPAPAKPAAIRPGSTRPKDVEPEARINEPSRALVSTPPPVLPPAAKAPPTGRSNAQNRPVARPNTPEAKETGRDRAETASPTEAVAVRGNNRDTGALVAPVTKTPTQPTSEKLSVQPRPANVRTDRSASATGVVDPAPSAPAERLNRDTRPPDVRVWQPATPVSTPPPQPRAERGSVVPNVPERSAASAIVPSSGNNRPENSANQSTVTRFEPPRQVPPAAPAAPPMSTPTYREPPATPTPAAPDRSSGIGSGNRNFSSNEQSGNNRGADLNNGNNNNGGQANRNR